jgi:hypothetical protein
MRRQHSYYPRPEGIFAVHTPIKSPAHPRIQAKLWPEYHPGYFGAFVRDPDGNNVEAVFHGAPPE